ncbi:MAG: nucleoside monophosphate kinase [bacterium]|nr:nucleoside monophosphate kinase [bacterium]
MELQTLIFMGPSGSGKGTQANLLDQYLRKYDTEHETFKLETGAGFRSFIEGDSYSAQLEKELMKNGVRAPDFLAIHIWSHIMIQYFKHSNQHVLIDGSPRSVPEAMALKTALLFYKLNKPTVLYFNASREWSIARMNERGRNDDDIENINRRLDWYERDVVPAIEIYREDPDVRVIEVDAEQTIEEVQAGIIEKLSLK